MTPTAQRIGILVIAIVMIVGTLGSFALLMLQTENASSEQEKLAKEYQDMMEKQQKETAERTQKGKELSKTYYPIFNEYSTRPSAFDAGTVGDKVTFTDLKEGDGAVIGDDSTYRAYYIGWNPKGVVFDTSIAGEELKPPLEVAPGMLVPGWYDGVEGMKIGGVREITLPSDLAYGEAGSGDNIPPNTPIKFVVMAIPASE